MAFHIRVFQRVALRPQNAALELQRVHDLALQRWRVRVLISTES